MGNPPPTWATITKGELFTQHSYMARHLLLRTWLGLLAPIELQAAVILAAPRSYGDPRLWPSGLSYFTDCWAAFGPPGPMQVFEEPVVALNWCPVAL